MLTSRCNFASRGGFVVWNIWAIKTVPTDWCSSKSPNVSQDGHAYDVCLFFVSGTCMCNFVWTRWCPHFHNSSNPQKLRSNLGGELPPALWMIGTRPNGRPEKHWYGDTGWMSIQVTEQMAMELVQPRVEDRSQKKGSQSLQSAGSLRVCVLL